MKIGIPKEVLEGETRVAVVPAMAPLLAKDGHEVMIQAGAGLTASFTDGEYREAGATVLGEAREIYNLADLILKVCPPAVLPAKGINEAALIREGTAVIGFLAPLSNHELIRTLAKKKATAFSMEFIPRITRAQSMDALSSMATVAGYRAVLVAANHLGKFFPLLMTAAGTITPSTVLVLGAGVAGLQAVATARRLGAKVEAFDPRPVVREQVESLGARFVEMEMPEDMEAAGGYAKELPKAFLKKEQEAIAARLSVADIVITTAQVFGKKPPLLITKAMTGMMRPGSVIVDLAAEQGGNCELTEPGRVVEKEGVRIVGAANLPATLPVHASQMYSKNITNLVRHVYRSANGRPDFGDEIVKGACIVRDGEIVNELVKNAMEKGGR